MGTHRTWSNSSGVVKIPGGVVKIPGMCGYCPRRKVGTYEIEREGRSLDRLAEIPGF